MSNPETSFRTLSAVIPAITMFMILPLLTGCGGNNPQTADEERNISAVLDSFHQAAAKADYDSYFRYFTEDAVFIGTDATERWDKNSFMVFAKPYFDRGKAWDFTAIERHISIDEKGEVAWFDELLDTQMKICRGSGVLVKLDAEWKIRHYVLSMTIPNDHTDTVVSLKAPIEERLIQQFSHRND